MMTLIKSTLVFIILTLAIRASAAELPDAPSPVLTRTLTIEIAANAASFVGDAYSTVHNWEPGQSEQSFPIGTRQIVGAHPTWPTMSRLIPIMVAEDFAAWKLERSPRRSLRIIGHAIPIAATIGHVAGIVNNITLPAPKAGHK